MTPERFAQIKQMFLEVCARSPAARASFLAERCGTDGELRAEVEALLAVHTEVTLSGAQGDVPPTSGAGRAHQVEPAARGRAVERDLQPGALVAGRFRVVALLGRGGMGEVYRADDLRLNQPVALKFLPLEFARDALWLERFHHEVRLARTITHPAVCRVYDLNEFAGDQFISMEYVDGENLKSLLARIGRLPGDKAADLARQLCAGLAAAHARGVLHRDLKPANVMLDGQGRIRIMDFGLAALHDQVRGAEIRAGTPAYMAPEQLSGAAVSVRSDIYSLGLLLYELFTGKPARGPAVSAARADSRPTSPSSVVPDISLAAERVILRCLEPDPADRPASVLEVAAALPGGDALRLAQELGETPSPTVVASAGHGAVNRRGAVAALVIVGALLVFTIVLGPRTHPLCRAGATKPPVVLAEKARQQLISSGITAGVHEAYGFTGLSPVESTRLLSSPVAQFAADSPELLFWYRNRTDPLTPLDAERRVFGGARTLLDDPPFSTPGETVLVLDLAGLLRAAQFTPPWADGQDAAPDWDVWHQGAGLDPDSLTVVALASSPATYTQRRWSWLAVAPTDPASTLRVEAEARCGQPAWYNVRATAPGADARAALADVVRRRTLALTAAFIVLAALVVLALPLARVNLLRGQSDPRGATRLALFVLAARAVASLLQAAHTPAVADEFRLLTLALTGAVGNAVLVWLLYMALEPCARRYRPQLLVSWVRVLSGRWRDPLVGRDLLLGAALGICGSLLYQLEGLTSATLGFTVRPRLLAADYFAPCLALRETIAFGVDALRFGVYAALSLTFLVVLLRHVLRRSVPAGIVAVLLLAPFLVPQGSHPATAGLFLGIGVGGGMVWASLRYGLVPVAVGSTVLLILLRLPLTYELHAWYVDRTVLAVLFIVAIAGYGFHAANRAARST